MALWFYGYMKTTLEVPDELYALVKAKAALEGRTMRSIVEELLKGWVAVAPGGASWAGMLGGGEAGATKDTPPALLAEPRSGYGKADVTLGDKPIAPWEVLSRQWAAQNDPGAPISSIAGTIKDAGPDLDMAKAREVYARHLAKAWRKRYP